MTGMGLTSGQFFGSVWHHLGAIDIEGHMVLPRLEPGKRHPPALPILCQAGRHSGSCSRRPFTVLGILGMCMKTFHSHKMVSCFVGNALSTSDVEGLAPQA